MPTFVSAGSGKEFTPAPTGTHQAVCVDVVDNGIMDTEWGKKHKVTLVWQLAELMDNDKPFICSKRYTASLHEKAVLRSDLEAWRGRSFTEAELRQFDLDTVIGANAVLSIIHRQGSKGGTFANVASVAPLMRGMSPIKGVDYVRQCERNAETADSADSHDTHDVDERTYEGEEPPF